jgi:hypothetical protein
MAKKPQGRAARPWYQKPGEKMVRHVVLIPEPITAEILALEAQDALDESRKESVSAFIVGRMLRADLRILKGARLRR